MQVEESKFYTPELRPRSPHSPRRKQMYKGSVAASDDDAEFDFELATDETDVTFELDPIFLDLDGGVYPNVSNGCHALASVSTIPNENIDHPNNGLGETKTLDVSA